MAKAARTSAGEQTSLATAAPSNDQLATAADVADFDFDFSATGLEGADDTDRKRAALVFNVKGKDESGRMRSLNEFFITDTEEIFTEVFAVFVGYTKTHAFQVYSEEKRRNQTICYSSDRVIGTLRKQHPRLQLAEGVQRNCKDCTKTISAGVRGDREWYRNEKGRNVQDCSEFSNVFCLLIDPTRRDEHGKLTPEALGREFMIRFGKTSRQPFADHLNKHHFGKHPKLRGKDVPLYAYAVRLTLNPDDGGIFAVPVIEKILNCNRDTNLVLDSIAKGFMEIREEWMEAAQRNEEKHAGAIDTEGESSGGGRRDEFADDDR